MTSNTAIMRSLSKALNMNELVVSEESKELASVPEEKEFELTPQEKEADADFVKARDALTNALSKGVEALNSAVLVAVSSQKQGGYDAVSSLLKEVTDATQKLMNLHDSRRGLVGQGEQEKQTSDPTAALIGNAQNVIVVKSPAALSQMMRQMKDERAKED